MVVTFTKSDIDIKNLTKIEDSAINPFLAENNKKQFEKIFDFYSGAKPILLVCGFMGAGKTQVVNHSLKFLDEKAIVLKYNCFETTILDDIFLSFFEDFKELVIQGKIAQPKMKSENFAQKIASYFNAINLPVVIVLNSFECVLKSNKEEILDFLFHTVQKNNIKSVIISRTVDYDDFEGKAEYEKVIIQALDKGIFEKYLRSEGIKTIGPVSDELYKHSRGYFLYTKLTTKIINIHKLALIDFIEGYTKSFLSYNDFILREALALVDAASGHLFRLLTLIRHPISLSILKTVNLYDEEKIKFFIENSLLSEEKNMVYLQDYYKEISQNSIPDNVSLKLHKSCIDLYTTQLPLKPFERDILISRQTMRAEIEYHTLFLPRKPQLVRPISSSEVEALGYSSDSAANYSSISKTSEGVPVENASKDNAETKEDKLRKISFIFDTEEEKQVMDDIAASINSFIDYSNKILTPEEMRLPFMELINSANREEKQYNYKKALAFYQLSLTMKEDDNFALMVSRIYTKMARCYEKLSDWFNALKYYDMTLEYFVNAGDMEKFNEMRYAIANVFYNTYKHDKAEKLLIDILNAQDKVSNELLIKAYLLLATINSDDTRKVYEYYKKAFALAEPSMSKKILAELYYKFGILCDDLGEAEAAIKLYKHCIEIQKDNPFTASAILNLAIVLDDAGDKVSSKKYYKDAIDINEAENNPSEVYEASLRLAKLSRRDNPEEAVNYYKLAVAKAKEINDVYYLIKANVEYGDFYSDNKDFKKALKAYIIALTKITDRNAEDYKQKIEQRIRDIKLRLGDEDFKNLEKEIMKND